MEHNTKTIIDAMETQTKQIMEEIVRKAEVINIKVTQESVLNGSNLVDVSIEQEEEEENNDCFDE